MRELVQAPVLSALSKVNHEMPNFVEVTAFIRRQLALMRLAPRGDRPIVILPILLLGQPGVGKTRYAHQIAKAIKVEFHEITFATTSASFVLKGSNLQWGEGQTGRIFEILADSKHINPLVLIDEVDKAITSNYQPINVLYELLEPYQARRFQDEALNGVYLNASYIIWMLTANEPNKIPPAIISRCQVFNIPVPNKKQMFKVAQSIYKSILEEKPWADKFESKLQDDVLNKINSMPPREIRKVLMDGLGRAAELKVNRVLPDSISVVCAKRKIGF
jgi:ATP-dependent Lon protease